MLPKKWVITRLLRIDVQWSRFDGFTGIVYSPSIFVFQHSMDTLSFRLNTISLIIYIITTDST